MYSLLNFSDDTLPRSFSYSAQVAISGETYSLLILMEITGVPLINFPIPTCWSHWIKFIFDSFPRNWLASENYWIWTRQSTVLQWHQVSMAFQINDNSTVCSTADLGYRQRTVKGVYNWLCAGNPTSHFWPYPMWCQSIHYYQVANWYPFCWTHSNSVPMEMIDTECWISPLIWFQCIILSLSFNLDILPSIEFFCVFLKTNTVARC